MKKHEEKISLELLASDFSNQITSDIDETISRNPMSPSDLDSLMKRLDSDKKADLKIAHADHPFTLQLCVCLEEMLQNPELNKSAFSVMIQGHPSSGKSTALKEVATRLNTFFEDENFQVLPIFSELQIRYSDIELSTTELWEKIVLGVNSYEFQTSEYSDSLNSFITLANNQALTPILFIDTLDFLISDQGISPKQEIGRVWDEFVTAALEGGVHIIFTTRSDEWTHFFSEYNTIDDQFSIDLPELMLPEIDTFHVNASIVELRDEFLQYTRVMQALLPILRHPREPVYEKMSDAELRDLIDDEVFDLDETKMKLLAQRCYLQSLEKSEFYTSFTTNLYKWFIDKMSAEVPFESNKDLLFDSPINIYYEMSWQKWQALSANISDQDKSQFKKAFIEVISEVTQSHNAAYGTVKYVFKSKTIIDKISTYYSGEKAYELLNNLRYCNILSIKNRYFQFRHQLFHKLTIAKSEGYNRQDFIYFFVNDFDYHSEDVIRLLGGIGAWFTDKNASFEKDKKMIYEFYPRAKHPQAPEQDEEQEDKLIRFFNSSRTTQYITGPAGTGKSRYALKFLDHQLKYRLDGKLCENLSMVYVTKQVKLRDAQERIWNEARDSKNKQNPSDFSLISSAENKKSEPQFQTVRDLLKLANVTERDKFVDYEEFKELYDAFVKDPSVYHDGTTPFVSSDTAWLEFIEGTYDRVTGEKVKNPETKYIQDRTVYDRFLQKKKIKPISNWAFLATKSVLKDPKKFEKFDVMVIDEIQDIYPPVAAYLLCLIKDQSKPNHLEKSLLFAGDEEQTINLSGFSWRQYVKDLFDLSLGKIHPGLKGKQIMRSFDTAFDSIHIERLRYGWRNPKSISTFNHSAFISYNNESASKDRYRDLKFIQPRNKRFLPSKIILIHADVDNEISLTNIIKSLDDVLYNDLEIRYRILNSLLVYPYALDKEQFDSSILDGENGNLTIQNTLMNSASEIKGREGRSIIIIHPYEWKELDIFGRRRRNRVKTPTVPDTIYNNMRFRMNVLFTRSTSIMFIVCPSRNRKIIISEIVSDLGEHVRPMPLPQSFEERMNYQDVIEWFPENINREELLEILPERVDTSQFADTYWFEQALERELNDKNQQNKDIAWRMYFENREQTSLKFDVTARILSGRTSNIFLNKQYGFDERDSSIKIHRDFNRYGSEDMCPYCKKQDTTLEYDSPFSKKGEDELEKSWLICKECNRRLSKLDDSEKRKFIRRFYDFQEKFSHYRSIEFDPAIRQNNFLRILENLRIRPVQSRPGTLHIRGMGPQSQELEKFHPMPTKLTLEDYFNLIYHFNDFVFTLILKDKDWLFGESPEAILKILNRLSVMFLENGEEFSYEFVSIDEVDTLQRVLANVNNCLEVCNSYDGTDDWVSKSRPSCNFNEFKDFIQSSGLFYEHANSFNHRQILKNLEDKKNQDIFDDEVVYKSMLFTVAAINRFIDHALTAGHSIDEMNKIMQSAGVGGNPGLDFDYKQEMWHLSNPFTCLHLSVEFMDKDSVFQDLISNRKGNYYPLIKNLTNELEANHERNQAVRKPSLLILSNISSLDYPRFIQAIKFSGDFSLDCESVIHFVLWNLGNNHSGLETLVYERLIEIVCQYHLEFKSYELLDAERTNSRLFTIFGNRNHPLENCLKRIVSHINSLLTSKDLEKRNRFSYDDYWGMFFLFISLRREPRKAPIDLFISLRNSLGQRYRTGDEWYTTSDLPNENLIPFRWEGYDRVWRPELAKDFWEHNMNLHPPHNNLNLNTIINYVFARNRRACGEFFGNLICKVLTNKVTCGPLRGLSKDMLTRIYESKFLGNGLTVEDFHNVFKGIDVIIREDFNKFRTSSKRKFSEYGKICQYVEHLVDLHVEDLQEKSEKTGEEINQIKIEIINAFSFVSPPLFLSHHHTPNRIQTRNGNWLKSNYSKWNGILDRDWDLRAENMFYARMENLYRYATDPAAVHGGSKMNVDKLIDRLKDGKFGYFYSKYIGRILSDNYENHDFSYFISKSMLGQSDKSAMCYSCSSENTSLLVSHYCQKCRLPTSDIDKQIISNGLYLLELYFTIFKFRFNLQRRGGNSLKGSLIENLKRLTTRNFESFVIDDILEEISSRNNSSWLIDFHDELRNPYFLTEESFEEIRINLSRRRPEMTDNTVDGKCTSLQNAVQFVGDDIPHPQYYRTESFFTDADEQEIRFFNIAHRRIDLLSKKFRNLVANFMGYTFEATNDRYLNTNKVEKIIRLCDEEGIKLDSNLLNALDKEEREFAKGYLIESESDEVYQHLVNQIMDIKKLLVGQPKTLNQIVKELEDPKINQLDPGLLRHIFNKLESGNEIISKVYDVDTGESADLLDSEETYYWGGIPEKMSEKIVVWDKSDIGLGIPIIIEKTHYPNWLKRKEQIEKEISGFVSNGIFTEEGEILTPPPVEEGEVIKNVGLHEYPGVFFLYHDHLTELRAIISSILTSDYLRYTKKEEKEEVVYLISRKEFDSLKNQHLRSEELDAKQILVLHDGIFSTN